jgi:hypothetical protein
MWWELALIIYGSGFLLTAGLIGFMEADTIGGGYDDLGHLIAVLSVWPVFVCMTIGQMMGSGK